MNLHLAVVLREVTIISVLGVYGHLKTLSIDRQTFNELYAEEGIDPADLTPLNTQLDGLESALMDLEIYQVCLVYLAAAHHRVAAPDVSLFLPAAPPPNRWMCRGRTWWRYVLVSLTRCSTES